MNNNFVLRRIPVNSIDPTTESVNPSSECVKSYRRTLIHRSTNRMESKPYDASFHAKSVKQYKTVIKPEVDIKKEAEATRNYMKQKRNQRIAQGNQTKMSYFRRAQDIKKNLNDLRQTQLKLIEQAPKKFHSVSNRVDNDVHSTNCKTLTAIMPRGSEDTQNYMKQKRLQRIAESNQAKKSDLKKEENIKKNLIDLRQTQLKIIEQAPKKCLTNKPEWVGVLSDSPVEKPSEPSELQGREEKRPPKENELIIIPKVELHTVVFNVLEEEPCVESPQILEREKNKKEFKSFPRRQQNSSVKDSLRESTKENQPVDATYEILHSKDPSSNSNEPGQKTREVNVYSLINEKIQSLKMTKKNSPGFSDPEDDLLSILDKKIELIKKSRKEEKVNKHDVAANDTIKFDCLDEKELNLEKPSINLFSSNKPTSVDMSSSAKLDDNRKYPECSTVVKSSKINLGSLSSKLLSSPRGTKKFDAASVLLEMGPLINKPCIAPLSLETQTEISKTSDSEKRPLAEEVQQLKRPLVSLSCSQKELSSGSFSPDKKKVLVRGSTPPNFQNPYCPAQFLDKTFPFPVDHSDMIPGIIDSSALLAPVDCSLINYDMIDHKNFPVPVDYASVINSLSASSIAPVNRPSISSSYRSCSSSNGPQASDICIVPTDNCSFKSSSDALHSTASLGATSRLKKELSNIQSVHANKMSKFSLQMFEHLCKDERLHYKQQNDLLELKKAVVINKAKADLTWLSVEKRNQKRQGGSKEALRSINKKARAIVLKYHQDLGEIQRMQKNEKEASRYYIHQLKEERHLILMQLNANKHGSCSSTLSAMKFGKKPVRKNGNDASTDKPNLEPEKRDHERKDAVKLESNTSSPCRIELHFEDLVNSNEAVKVGVDRGTSPLYGVDRATSTDISVDRGTSTHFLMDHAVSIHTGVDRGTSPLNMASEGECALSPSPAVITEPNAAQTINQSVYEKGHYHFDGFVSSSLVLDNSGSASPSDSKCLQENFKKSGKKSIASIKVPLSPRITKRKSSSGSDESMLYSQNDTSEVSDLEARVCSLQHQLKQKEAELKNLKRLRSRSQRELLKAKEQAVIYQIKTCDAHIEQIKADLEQESELSSIKVVKPQIKQRRVADRRKSDVAIVYEKMIEEEERKLGAADDGYTREGEKKLDAADDEKEKGDERKFSAAHDESTRKEDKRELGAADSEETEKKIERKFSEADNEKKVMKDEENIQLASDKKMKAEDHRKLSVVGEENKKEDHRKPCDAEDEKVEEYLWKPVAIDEKIIEEGERKLDAYSEGVETNESEHISSEPTVKSIRDNLEESVCEANLEKSFSESNSSKKLIDSEGHSEKSIDVSCSCSSNTSVKTPISTSVQVSCSYSSNSDELESMCTNSSSLPSSLSLSASLLSAIQRAKEYPHNIKGVEVENYSVLTEESTDITEPVFAEKDACLVLSDRAVSDSSDKSVEIKEAIADPVSDHDDASSDSEEIFSESDLSNLVEEMNHEEVPDEIILRILEDSLVANDRHWKTDLTESQQSEEKTPILTALQREKDKNNSVDGISQRLFNDVFESSAADILKVYFRKRSSCDSFEDSSEFEFYEEKADEVDEKTFWQDEGATKVLAQQEAEKLRLKQLQIEQEIEELELEAAASAGLSGYYVREIPNKPPPPYSARRGRGAPSSAEVLSAVELAVSSLWDVAGGHNLPCGPQPSPPSDFLAPMTSQQDSQFRECLWDLCIELYSEMRPPPLPPCPPWLVHKKRKKLAPLPRNKEEVLRLAKREVSVLFGYQPAVQKENMIIRWSRKKRDTVDEILVRESQEEEANWVDFTFEENLLKNRIVDRITQNALQEAVSAISRAFQVKFSNSSG